ncbi:MAG: translocation/assembly module TamB [Prevotellaceae bacterium]|nr:translocation/assembly module TamB [Prevotellaceae bacterium]
MKKIRHIVLIVLGIIVSLNILVMILLNIPFIQQKALRITVSWLQEKTHSKISAGHLRLNLFRGVSLDEVFLADQRGDTLLYVGSLTANTSLLYVYQNNTLRIDDVRLEDFKVFLSRDSDSAPFNFQFLVDAFSSKDTTSKAPSSFDLVIRNIDLRNGTFRYDIFSGEETPARFNASHIHVRKLDGQLSLGSIRPDKFSARIYRLSAEEQSGVSLQNLHAQIDKDQEKIHLVNFGLDLPNSHLNLSDAWFDSQQVLSNGSSDSKNGIYYVQIEKSEIVPEDLRAFYPPLAGLSKSLKLEGLLNDTVPSLGINTLNASYGDEITMSLSGASMSNWGDYRKSNYTADISQLFLSQEGIKTILQVTSPETKLPEIAGKLGDLQSHLTINGNLERLLVNGDLTAAPGSVSINGNIGYNTGNGNFTANTAVLSNSFDLNTILDPSLQVGKSAFDVHATITISQGKNPDIHVAGTLPFFTFRNYVYQQVVLDGEYRGMNDITAQLRLDDKNLSLDLDGKVLQAANRQPEYHLNGSIRHLNPFNLHLTNNFKDTVIGMDIRMNVQGDKPENMTGEVRLEHFYIASVDTILQMDSLLVTAEKTVNNEKLLQLISPYINARVEGVYNPVTIVRTAQNILHGYLPTFFDYAALPKNAVPNNFSYSITLKNAGWLLNLFHSPVMFNKQSSIWGEFRDSSNEISLYANFPELFYGKIPLEETVINLRKETNAYLVNVRSNIAMQTPICAEVTTEIANDTVAVHLSYDNSPTEFSFFGEIQSRLSFKKEMQGKGLILTADFLPSNLTVNDLQIGFKPATVIVKPGNIAINDFGLTHDNQPFFGIDGVVSASAADTLQVFFKRASISTLLGGLDLAGTVPVNGYMDGTVYFSQLLEKPRFYTRAFHVDELTYDNDSLGTLILNSRWNERQNGMNVGLSLIRSNDETISAGGLISPAEDLIRLNVNLHSLPIEVAQPFLNGIVHNLNGYCGSDLKVDGKLSAPDISGYFYLQDASATVDYTDVTYRFSDTIRFTPTSADITNMLIYDSKNQTARLNFAVKHDHLSNFTYSGSLQLNNFLALNNPSKTDSLVHGILYVNGNLTVKGDMEEVTVGGKLSNGDHSNVKIHLPESATQANTYRTIVYVDTKATNFEMGKSQEKNNFSIKAKADIELTKGAKLGVIISSSLGDGLSIQGDGNITADYDSEASGIRLFGQYTVDNGSLKLKVSQLSKSFTIQQGSRINMNGDPMMSNFDVTALYQLRSDLNSLDASFATLGLVQTRMLVNCILHIQGNLNRLNLDYQISLPDANDDINQLVNSIINTDDLRIKEFAYLVGFGSFFPPHGQASGGNVMTSLATSSLSTALNGALSGVLGNNWTIGTDLNSKQGDFSDVEMNVYLSTQLLNDRLIINSSVGYRNGNTTETPWIGDFDVAYKLTKTGSIQAKAYSHTNNEIFRTANTTQGVGMVFSREGKRFGDLFRLRKRKELQQTEKNPVEIFEEQPVSEE